MTIEEIKQFLEENKDNEEVQSLFTGYVPKATLDAYLDSDEGKKLVQPKLDKNFTKGLETWKANNLSKIVEDEVSKRNPSESPEQKNIRELQDKLSQMERKANLEKMKSSAIKSLNEKGLPVGLADYINADTDEGFSEVISYLELEYKKALETAVNDKLKGKTPQQKQEMGTGTGITKAQLLALPMAERVKFFSEDPETFNKLMKS